MFFYCSAIALDFTSSFSHCYIENVNWCVYVCVICIDEGKWCQFSTNHCLGGICSLRVLSFWRSNLILVGGKSHHH